MKTVTLFVLGLVLICFGGDKLVDAAVAVARKLGIPRLVVGATIVSLGTTLPEILVSTTAAFGGSASISAGNAFGSIICNAALIAGVTQTIRPCASVETASMKWRTLFFFVTLIVVETVGVIRKEFSHLLGVILLAEFCLYAWLNIRNSTGENSGEEDGTEETGMVAQIITFAVSVAALYFGANLLVDNGILIAKAAGVSERVIAVTFIALGTSLPELVTSIISLCKGYSDVGIGNIIGANLLNLLLVIGIPAAVMGIPVEMSTLVIDIPLGGLVMAILFVPMLLWKKSSRIQGVLLSGIYLLYCILSF